MYLSEGTTYTGTVNGANEGEVYVEIESGSKWVLTGDSYITGLTCEAGAIDLNGYKLYVGSTEYSADTASTGTAITIATESSSSGRPEGMPGEPPSGDRPDGEKPSGDFPGDPPSGDKPQGDPPSGDPPSGSPGGNGGEPPAKPSEKTT